MLKSLWNPLDNESNSSDTMVNIYIAGIAGLLGILSMTEPANAYAFVPAANRLRGLSYEISNRYCCCL